jgi:hypothetical protein
VYYIQNPQQQEISMLRRSSLTLCNTNIKQLLMQPTLVGNLLTLSPVRADDHDALFQVAKDPQIWTQHPAWDRYKPDVFRNFFNQGLDSGRAPAQ